MPDFQGEKTEQPTPRRLEEAAKKGQVPRSAEVQTVAAMLGALLGMMFGGQEIWRHMVASFSGLLGHLHNIPISADSMQGHLITGVVMLAMCAGPMVLAVMLSGLLAGAAQSRFQTASEVLSVDWNRVNPAEGVRKLLSFQSAVPTVVAIMKIGVLIVLTYSQIVSILQDPIFYSAVSAGRIGQFLASASFSIILRVCGALMIIAALDYTYQWWKTSRDLMMTKNEVKDETKNAEGNPLVKNMLRRRRQRHTQRRMLLEVPKADVVLTNPTHLAVALRYDRKTMKAPRVVAKGSRLNAAQIREIARRHQVPVVENKPLARLLFKHARVGSEIPAQLYAAVAEILAWVYRVNRYRYYTESNHLAA
jgi:flagellar biosynthesis protein FlhB